MAATLEGTRVVDLTTGMVGAVLGMMLADHGAEVLKVEPLGGDPLRQWDASLIWHRGKQSIVLDLEKPEGRDLLPRMLEGTDLLLENFRPGLTAELGIDYASLRSRFPKLVYATVEGYATEEENRTRPHYGELVEARLGFQSEQRGHRRGPIYLGWPHANWGAVFTTAIGAMAALYYQRLTGKGQQVKSSLEEGAVILSTSRWIMGDNLQDIPYNTSLMMYRHVRAIVSDFECMDGEWLTIHTMARGAFTRLMRVLGFDHMIDPTIDPAREQGVPLPPEIVEQFWVDLTAEFYTRPRDEWVELIRQAEIPVMPIYRRGEALRMEQIKANEIAVEFDDPDWGHVEAVGLVHRFQRTPGAVPPRLAAAAGTHTDAILERCGCGPEQIAALRSTGVVA